MKHFLFILMLIPAVLSAQNDQKYLAGAVPEERGKVVFSKVVDAPALSKDQIYDALMNWANKRFTVTADTQGKVMYSNKEKGEIVCMGNEELIFTDNALVTDKSTIMYRMTFICTAGKCQMKVSSIRYVYDVPNQEKSDKYTAEEWITDDQALTKQKDKLARVNGKFRAKTIDLVDELFAAAQAAIIVK